MTRTQLTARLALIVSACWAAAGAAAAQAPDAGRWALLPGETEEQRLRRLREEWLAYQAQAGVGAAASASPARPVSGSPDFGQAVARPRASAPAGTLARHPLPPASVVAAATPPSPSSVAVAKTSVARPPVAAGPLALPAAGAVALAGGLGDRGFGDGGVILPAARAVPPPVAAAFAPLAAAGPAAPPDTRPYRTTNEMLVELRPGVDPAAVARTYGLTDAGGLADAAYFRIFRAGTASAASTAHARLAADARVAGAELFNDAPLRSQSFSPNDPFFFPGADPAVGGPGTTGNTLFPGQWHLENNGNNILDAILPLGSLGGVGVVSRLKSGPRY